MEYAKLTFRIIQYTLSAVVIGVVALLILGHFGYVDTVKPFVVQSGSMEPSVPTASIVFTFPQNSYQQGDIITFHPNGNDKQTVTHRIEFKLYPDGINEAPLFMTAGDANKDVDKWEVRHEHIIGKTVLTVPYLGYLVDFAKKPEGFILLVIVPATIVIYEELKALFMEIIKGIRRPKNRSFKGENLKGSRTTSSPPKIWIVFPLLGVMVFMVSFSAGYFTDLEKSLGNIFQAGTWGTEVPNVTPTPTESVTPTPSPIPSDTSKTSSLYLSDPFTCAGGAADTSGSILGESVFEIDGSNLKVTVTLVGVTPLSTYDIWINQDPGGCPLDSPSFPAAFTTDISGNGVSGVLSLPLVSGATNFWVSAVGGGQVLRSSAVTFP